MPIVLRAYRQDKNHNFKELPEALAILTALRSLRPQQHLDVTMPDFLTMRSFSSYVRRHYKGEYAFKNVIRTSIGFERPDGTTGVREAWSCKVIKRKEKRVAEQYGLKKRRLFLAVIDSFVRHGLVHYSSTCKQPMKQDVEQSIAAGKTELLKTQATQLTQAMREVVTNRSPTALQVGGVYRAAEAMNVPIFLGQEMFLGQEKTDAQVT